MDYWQKAFMLLQVAEMAMKWPDLKLMHSMALKELGDMQQPQSQASAKPGAVTPVAKPPYQPIERRPIPNG